MCMGCSNALSESHFNPVAHIMPSLFLWYIAACRVTLAKPIIDSPASFSLPPSVGSDTIEQLDLNPANHYSSLPDGSSTQVPNPINQDNPNLFGTADLTLTGAAKEQTPERFSASAALPDSVVPNIDFPKQDVPEQGAALYPSISVVRGDDSAKQNLPVASTDGPLGSFFQDSGSLNLESSQQLDLSGSAVQNGGSSGQDSDKTTPFSNPSVIIAQGNHLAAHSCSTKHARSVKNKVKKRNPGESSRPLKGPRPPKAHDPQAPTSPQNSPGQASTDSQHTPVQAPTDPQNLPGQVSTDSQDSPVQAPKVPQILPGESNDKECFYIPKCEPIHGQMKKLYCCPYMQQIGYDDRFVSTRAGCTDCSCHLLSLLHFILRIPELVPFICTTDSSKTNVCTVSLENVMCERGDDWKGAFCCFPGYTVCTRFFSIGQSLVGATD